MGDESGLVRYEILGSRGGIDLIFLFKLEWKSFGDNTNFIPLHPDNFAGVAKFDDILSQVLHLGGILAKNVLE